MTYQSTAEVDLSEVCAEATFDIAVEWSYDERGHDIADTSALLENLSLGGLKLSRADAVRVLGAKAVEALENDAAERFDPFEAAADDAANRGDALYHAHREEAA